MNVLNLRTRKVCNLDFGNKVCLVGSSGVLLGRDKGTEIDRFDGKIIRMNSACIRGFEKDVGSRCDVRVVAYNALVEVWKLRGRLDLEREGGVMLLWGAPAHKRNGFGIVAGLAKEFPKLGLFEVSSTGLAGYDGLFQKFIGVPRLASGAWLSTGWVTLCSLLGGGCEVDVFGMFGAGKLYHYWDAGRGVADQHYKEQQFGKKGHRFLTEQKVFVDIWTKMYKLKFVL